MTRPGAPLLTLAAGVVVLVAGVVLYLASGVGDGFGWFAYAPLAGEGPVVTEGAGARLYVLTTSQVVGLSVAALGVLVLVGTAAYRLGRARAAR